MAYKMKITPMRAVHEKVKRENARRVREMKGEATKRKESEKERREEYKKDNNGKEQREEGRVKKTRRGLKSLKEIKRYQMSTETLMWRLPFQRVVHNIAQGIRADMLSKHSHHGTAGGRRSIPCRTFRTVQPMYNSCKVHNNHT